jgi:retinol dehydrogenase 12
MWEYFVYTSIVILLIYIIRKVANGPETPLKDQVNLSGKIIIVTGSNTGIGKVAALEMLSKGAKVIFAARDEQRTLSVINSIQDPEIRNNACFIKLDLSSFDSIKNFVEEFKRNFNYLDILVNNAGASFDTFELKDNIEKTIMTNHIGPVLLTSLLVDIIRPQGKIINVSSRGHKDVGVKDLNYLYAGQETDFSNMKNDYRHLMLYCLSKLGNVYHARYLADYFNKNNIPVKTASLHPGVVMTDIFQPYRRETFLKKLIFCSFAPLLWLFGKDVYMGAQTTLHVAYLNYDLLNSGDYFSNCSVEKLKDFARDQNRIDEMMSFTKKQILTKCPDLPKNALEYL